MANAVFRHRSEIHGYVDTGCSIPAPILGPSIPRCFSVVPPGVLHAVIPFLASLSKQQWRAHDVLRTLNAFVKISQCPRFLLESHPGVSDSPAHWEEMLTPLCRPQKRTTFSPSSSPHIPVSEPVLRRPAFLRTPTWSPKSMEFHTDMGEESAESATASHPSSPPGLDPFLPLTIWPHFYVGLKDQGTVTPCLRLPVLHPVGKILSFY